MNNYEHLKQRLTNMRLEREAWESRMQKIDAEREERAHLRETRWQLATLYHVRRFTLKVFDYLETVLSNSAKNS